MNAAVDFDWKNPRYEAVVAERIERLAALRAQPALLVELSAFYRDHPAHFICDWGTTHDPRNIERDLPALVPFLLWPRQVDFVDYIMARWKAQGPGRARDREAERA
jgi:phage terminase large subunit